MIKFIDDVVTRNTGPHNGPVQQLVYSLTAVKENGVYHKLKQNEHSRIEAFLSSFTHWLIDIKNNNMVGCGRYYSIEGAGRGQCELVHKYLGPFLN